MKIAVFIKQVPDTKSVQLDPETHTLKREGVESIINPFDMYAIEAGLMLKDRYGGETTVITMGPPQAEEALRQALGMGIDHAVLLSDKAFAGADTWATSLTLANAVEKFGGFDILVCGKQASDGDTAQVGPEMACHLDVPYATFVSKIVDVADGRITVHRLMDFGYEVLRLPCPGLITVVKEVGDPRLPSLRGKMRAKKAEIPVLGAADLGLEPGMVGLNGSYTEVVKVFTPERSGKKETVSGTAEEIAARLYELIKGMKIKGI